VVDRDLRYLRINETLARLNGVPAADHIGRTVPQLFPQLEEFVRSITSAILATGRPVLNVEHASQMPSRPGERQEWRSDWLPIRQPDGTLSAFLVNVTEITDRRRADAALAANLQAQEFLIAIALRLLHPIEPRELFDFVTERIYSLTEGGIVLFSEFDPADNRTTLRAVGMTPDERARAGAVLGRDPSVSTSCSRSRYAPRCCPASSRACSAGCGN
jgi:PAS domain S-box-containing protein